jgi:hypothetical protein
MPASGPPWPASTTTVRRPRDAGSRPTARDAPASAGARALTGSRGRQGRRRARRRRPARDRRQHGRRRAARDDGEHAAGVGARRDGRVEGERRDRLGKHVGDHDERQQGAAVGHGGREGERHLAPVDARERHAVGDLDRRARDGEADAVAGDRGRAAERPREVGGAHEPLGPARRGGEEHGEAAHHTRRGSHEDRAGAAGAACAPSAAPAAATPASATAASTAGRPHARAATRPLTRPSAPPRRARHLALVVLLAQVLALVVQLLALA